MSPLNWGDWNSDTASSSNVDIQGDTFTLATTAITSFEGDLSAFSGDTGDFETTTDQAFDGTQSLGKTTGGQHSAIWITDAVYTSGESFTLSAWVYTGDNEIRGGPTLVDASTGNGYIAYVDAGTGLNISTATPTWSDNIASTSIGLETNQFYNVELSHDGNDGLSATLFDYNGSDHTVTATDGTYAPNTVGANAYDIGWYADFYEEV
jgi:hypothetical protein